jgi:hypothetical protein
MHEFTIEEQQKVLRKIRFYVYLPSFGLFLFILLLTRVLDSNSPNGGFGVALFSTIIVLPIFIIYTLFVIYFALKEPIEKFSLKNIFHFIWRPALLDLVICIGSLCITFLLLDVIRSFKIEK